MADRLTNVRGRVRLIMPSRIGSSVAYLLALLIITTGTGIASPSITESDMKFKACAKREKMNLVSCTSGCGLILKRCYDEAIEGYEKEIRGIDKTLANSECKRRAKEASTKADAFRDEVERLEEAGSWQQMDLRLLLTRSKLQLIETIAKGCQPR